MILYSAIHRTKILNTFGYTLFKFFGLQKSTITFPFTVENNLSLCASLIEALFLVTLYPKKQKVH